MNKLLSFINRYANLRNALIVTAFLFLIVVPINNRLTDPLQQLAHGVSISSSAVSQASAQLDSELTKWWERPLGAYPFLFLDAYCEQVREDG